MRRILSAFTAVLALLLFIGLNALDAEAAKPGGGGKPPKPTATATPTPTVSPSPTVTPTATATPQPGSYVAIGDSYAAGDGARSYLSDGTECYRSLLGYPGLIASSRGLTLRLEACSGATTADVLATQLTQLAGAEYITITVGGNDIGFADTISTCMGLDTNACLAAVTAAESKAASLLPGQLGKIYAQARAAAPGAVIVATDYPRLFNGSDCSLLTTFTSTEMVALNRGADTLSDVIRVAADAAGIGFADVRGPFEDHAVCDTDPWIHNASLWTSYESFHPNASGYRYGYTPEVITALAPTSTGLAGTLKVTTGGQTSSDTTRGHVKVTAQG